VKKTSLRAILPIVFVLGLSARLAAQAASLDPAKMNPIGTVDERFHSYNIEMVEVTGGKFWKPYKSNGANAGKAQARAQQSEAIPSGMDPNLYEYRPPINLTNARLLKLAAALGPAYVRVSGTWANTVYFQNDDNPSRGEAPPGFSGVLTRKEWKGVIDFAHAANAEIVTSFSTSTGTRDARGVWVPEQARQSLAYTKSAGGRIAAAEFMNEPTYAAMGGAPKGYDAAAYARDVTVFRQFIRQAAPDMLFLGPGSVGEGPFAMGMGSGMLKSEDLLRATGPVFDIFSYHLYAGASKRCASLGASSQTVESEALSQDWLSRPEKIDAFYAGLRDRSEPSKPLWITETADTACGGNPWASTFLDTFRYLIEHATLAQRGVKVIMHNTLASSDYGLLDENTFQPRPNYWAALLWRRLMGTTVLKPDPPPAPKLYVYAQCLRRHSGGVTLLVLNADQHHAYGITIPYDMERYTLTATHLQNTAVQLNGTVLELDSNDNLPQIAGKAAPAGRVSFAPASITFLAIANAGNSSCR